MVCGVTLHRMSLETDTNSSARSSGRSSGLNRASDPQRLSLSLYGAIGVLDLGFWFGVRCVTEYLRLAYTGLG